MAGHRRTRHWSIADFSLGEVLGEGRYGRVVHAVVKQPNNDERQAQSEVQSSPSLKSRPTIKDHPARHVAIKIMDKTYLARTKQTEAALRERKILTALTTESLQHAGDCEPMLFVPRLLMSFVDPVSFFIVTEVCDGGSLTDLVRHIREGGDDTLHCQRDEHEENKWDQYLRYISAQLLRGIEFLHFRGCVIHRDLKPDHILLLSNGHVRIVDFGSAIHLEEANTAAAEEDDNVFVGTADYVAPEILRGCSAGKGSASDVRWQSPALDIWSYGCIIHYMFAFRSPFHASSDFLAMVAVLAHSDGSIPMEVDPRLPADAKDLVERLLVNEPKRLGYSDREEQQKSDKSDDDDIERHYKSIWEHKYFAECKKWGLDEGEAPHAPRSPPTPSWVELYENGTTQLKDGATIDNDLEWHS
mmetsp:Transcript_10783/g.21875  ORF Transcript_10783/g.21875 Transcript_10783/m.21875 type:complete len:415 (+) Transcript_10783:813-2057(+)